MALSQTAAQSPDAKTLYLTDTSTDDPTGYTRTFTLYDGINATGNLVATLIIPDGEDTVEYSVTQDKYYSSRLTYTGGATLTPSVINFGLERFALNARDSVLLKNCGGCKGKSGSKVCEANAFIEGAEDAVLFGNSAKFNSFISSAYKLLT
jgi:hypothetical protein